MIVWGWSQKVWTGKLILTFPFSQYEILSATAWTLNPGVGMLCSIQRKLLSCGCLTSSSTRSPSLSCSSLYCLFFQLYHLVVQATQIRAPKYIVDVASVRLYQDGTIKSVSTQTQWLNVHRNASMPSSSALSWFYRYSARKNYDLYCGMDFRMFPMDTQAPKTFAF